MVSLFNTMKYFWRGSTDYADELPNTANELLNTTSLLPPTDSLLPTTLNKPSNSLNRPLNTSKPSSTTSKSPTSKLPDSTASTSHPPASSSSNNIDEDVYSTMVDEFLHALESEYKEGAQTMVKAGVPVIQAVCRVMGSSEKFPVAVTTDVLKELGITNNVTRKLTTKLRGLEAGKDFTVLKRACPNQPSLYGFTLNAYWGLLLQSKKYQQHVLSLMQALQRIRHQNPLLLPAHATRTLVMLERDVAQGLTHGGELAKEIIDSEQEKEQEKRDTAPAKAPEGTLPALRDMCAFADRALLLDKLVPCYLPKLFQPFKGRISGIFQLAAPFGPVFSDFMAVDFETSLGRIRDLDFVSLARWTRECAAQDLPKLAQGYPEYAGFMQEFIAIPSRFLLETKTFLATLKKATCHNDVANYEVQEVIEGWERAIRNLAVHEELVQQLLS